MDQSDEASMNWRADALCTQVDPEVFFPEKGQNSPAAHRICEQCDVQTQCLTEALETNEKHGIWGGKSEHQRRILRRRLIAAGEIFTDTLARDRQRRNAAILAQAKAGFDASEIAERFGLTDRSIHRVLRQVRGQVDNEHRDTA